MDGKADGSELVIGAAIEVHRILQAGLLESLYHKALCHELTLRGIPFQSQAPVPVHYKGVFIGDELKIDILLPDRLVVELKAVDRIHPIHEAQLLTYLKLTGIHTGLLINFNVLYLRDGIKRMAW
jgi:GxxExxY protein